MQVSVHLIRQSEIFFSTPVKKMRLKYSALTHTHTKHTHTHNVTHTGDGYFERPPEPPPPPLLELGWVIDECFYSPIPLSLTPPPLSLFPPPLLRFSLSLPQWCLDRPLSQRQISCRLQSLSTPFGRGGGGVEGGNVVREQKDGFFAKFTFRQPIGSFRQLNICLRHTKTRRCYNISFWEIDRERERERERLLCDPAMEFGEKR